MTELAGFLEYWLTGFPPDFPWFVALLLFTGTFMTIFLGFPQLTKLKHAFQVISGKFDDPDESGDVNHFQALTIALSATVGVGNIAGVALAIHYGGPGAVFWMWVTAFFGMALKFSECTLALKYRSYDANGNISGGPMYTIEKAMGWKPMAMFFAVCVVFCSFGSGNMNQSNTVSSIFVNRGYFVQHEVGLMMAILVGIVIIGGVKRIARVTEKLAPLMAVLYFVAAAIILALHYDTIPSMIKSIVFGAFNPQSAFGGTAAGAFTVTMLIGIKRGLFSNEAGQGSAPIAHASAKTEEPVREGVVALAEPFIDTLVICSLTALVILSTGTWNQKYDQVLQPHSVIVAKEIKNGEPVKYSGKLTINQGIISSGVLCKNHAAVDDGLILKDGKPYTGEIQVKSGKLPFKKKIYSIKGKALLVGAPLTSMAFKTGLSSLFTHGDLIVDLCVLLFAISTMISWSYYGDRAFQYLFSVKYTVFYKLLFCGFIYLGSIIALELVWRYGDLALAMMSIPNLISVLFLSREIRKDTKEYMQKYGV
jgi:AGCS family alanine or glycine:cation symporter